LDAKSPGAWRGLEFWSGTDRLATRLHYCRVEYAGAGGTAAVVCYSAPIAVQSTLIRAAAADGILCSSAGFQLFEGDSVTGCAAYPLRIGAADVATIGTGNSFSGNGRDTVRVSAGTIAANVHQWRRQNVPLLIEGMVSVGSSAQATLVVDPGSVLAFSPAAGIEVGNNTRGTIVAVGVPDSITFTGASPVPGAWRGLEIRPGSGSGSRGEHCRLLYGGGNGLGIVVVDSCLPIITGNEIGYSGSNCVYLYNTDLDPQTIRQNNLLHDWAPGYEDVRDEGR
jgi:hypothetical protein